MERCPYCNGTGQIDATLGVRLVALRTAKNMTQGDVAEHLHVSRAQIANLERGRGEASVPFILRAASFFEVSTDYLLGRDPAPKAGA